MEIFWWFHVLFYCDMPYFTLIFLWFSSQFATWAESELFYFIFFSCTWEYGLRVKSYSMSHLLLQLDYLLGMRIRVKNYHHGNQCPLTLVRILTHFFHLLF